MSRNEWLMLGGIAVLWLLSKEREWSAKLDQFNRQAAPISQIAGTVQPWLAGLDSLLRSYQ